MRTLNITVHDIVFPARMARIDTSLRRRIGHDLFYFSSAQSMKLFDRNPLKYVKRLSDPITEDRFAVRSGSPHADYKDRTYYFASDSTRAQFVADPDHWRERRGAPAMVEPVK